MLTSYITDNSLTYDENLCLGKMVATSSVDGKVTPQLWARTWGLVHPPSKRLLLKLAGQGRQEGPQRLQGQTGREQICAMMLQRRNGGKS